MASRASSAGRDDWRSALNFMRHASALDLLDEGIVNTGLSAVSHAEKWEQSTAILAAMGNCRLQCSAVTLSSAVSPLGRKSSWKRAVHILDDTASKHGVEHDSHSL
eukprot:1396567-Amphidinium_carterae.1